MSWGKTIWALIIQLTCVWVWGFTAFSLVDSRKEVESRTSTPTAILSAEDEKAFLGSKPKTLQYYKDLCLGRTSICTITTDDTTIILIDKKENK